MNQNLINGIEKEINESSIFEIFSNLTVCDEQQQKEMKRQLATAIAEKIEIDEEKVKKIVKDCFARRENRSISQALSTPDILRIKETP